jgi:hypothetical protein
MLADLLKSAVVGIILYGLLHSSEDFHVESQVIIHTGQVFNGAFDVNFSSLVLGLVEDALDVRVKAGLAWRPPRALASH